jgi:hypothetical protein
MMKKVNLEDPENLLEIFRRKCSVEVRTPVFFAALTSCTRIPYTSSVKSTVQPEYIRHKEMAWYTKFPPKNAAATGAFDAVVA